MSKQTQTSRASVELSLPVAAKDMIEKMAVVLGHELRNPLSGIKMAVHYLRRRYAENGEEVLDILSDIEGAVERANAVLEQVTLFARPPALRCEPVWLEALLRHCVERLAEEIAARQAVIDWDALVEDCPVSGDKVCLAVAISNVLRNALDAAVKAPFIRVGLKRAANTAVLCISDQGEGISAAMLADMAQPFVSSRARAVGLGLTNAVVIISRHQGTIAVESQPGKGTTVTIRLPCIAS